MSSLVPYFVLKFKGQCIHCYKTLRRIPPPWPDGAGPNGQGRGKWLPYMVREFPGSGSKTFQHFSETRNFPEIYMILSQGGSFPMLVFYIPRCRKTFPEFSGDFTLWKNQRACAWWDRTPDLRHGNPHLYLYTMITLHGGLQNLKIFFFIYSTSCTRNKRMSEFSLTLSREALGPIGPSIFKGQQLKV